MGLFSSRYYLSGYNILLISRYLPKLKRNVSFSPLRSSVICFRETETSEFFCNQGNVMHALAADKQGKALQTRQMQTWHQQMQWTDTLRWLPACDSSFNVLLSHPREISLQGSGKGSDLPTFSGLFKDSYSPERTVSCK